MKIELLKEFLPRHCTSRRSDLGGSLHLSRASITFCRWQAATSTLLMKRRSQPTTISWVWPPRRSIRAGRTALSQNSLIKLLEDAEFLTAEDAYHLSLTLDLGADEGRDI